MKPHDLEMDMTSLGATTTLGEPLLRKACVIRADLGPALQYRTVQGHVRAVFPIVGGEARGHGWGGRILPGGSDFAIQQPDGSYAIEARYCLELEDGTPMMVTNSGIMAPQPDGSFKGRTRAILEAPDGPHRRLANAVYFGTALAEPGDEQHVYIELWEAPI
jgi:hypothetical protein